MDQILGQISHFPWHWQIRGWAPCRGQIVQIQHNEALFSLLGTNFGGDGRTTFALPDLRPKDENNQPREWQYDEIVPHISITGLYPSRE